MLFHFILCYRNIFHPFKSDQRHDRYSLIWPLRSGIITLLKSYHLWGPFSCHLEWFDKIISNKQYKGNIRAVVHSKSQLTSRLIAQWTWGQVSALFLNPTSVSKLLQLPNANNCSSGVGKILADSKEI